MNYSRTSIKLPLWGQLAAKLRWPTWGLPKNNVGRGPGFSLSNKDTTTGGEKVEQWWLQ